VGEVLTVINLRSDQPRVSFQTGVTSPVQRVYEDDSSVTLILIASGTGSIDAIIIDKESGKFARVQATKFAGVHATAAIGIFR
jgi:hypothetical protein